MLTVRGRGQGCLAGVVKVLGQKQGAWRSQAPPHRAPLQVLGTLLLYCLLWVFFHSSHCVSSISSGVRAKLARGSSSRTLRPHILGKGTIRGDSSICQEVPSLA